MTVRFDLFFDDDLGYYRVRFWGDGVNTVRKVPEKFWRELGHRTPAKPESKFEKLAVQWAGKVASDITDEFANRSRQRRKMTFAETWSLYKRENPDAVKPATITRNDLCARSIAAYAKTVGREDVYPEEIDIAFATQFRNWRTPQVSARTVWNELQFMKQQCTFAFAWQSETMCEAVRLVRLPRVEMPENSGVALTEEEFDVVLEHAKKPRDRQILIAGVTTRLRRQNLFGLRGENFDRERRLLTIRRELLKGGRRKVRRDLSVPVADWTLDQIGDRTGVLWPSERTGEPLGWWEHVLEQLIADSGVRAFSVHDLRTTGNSWLDAAGVDKMTQAYLLGHSQGEDVTDIYRKKFEPELRAAVAVFDEIRLRNNW